MKLIRKRRHIFGKNSIYITIALLVTIMITIGYAYLNSSLNIVGNSSMAANTWDVHFENIQIKEGSKQDANVEIVNSSTTVNFDINLEEQGEYLDFTVDIVNNGTIDAMISNVTQTGISETSKAYLDYSLTYIDGQEIKENDLLEAGVTEKIHVIAKYKDNIDTSLLPEDDVIQEVTLSINYVQSDETAKDPGRIVCRRATALHSETCTKNDNKGCKNQGYSGVTLTYGSLGTAGNLVAGDAFDCDVNMDGVYNSETERFYYVSDLDTNSNYSVLIYDDNVYNGQRDNVTPAQYHTNNNSYQGPTEAKKHLPTTSQWKNVSLASTTRNIKDDAGTIRVTNFSYAGYAARLLTIQEVKSISVCRAGTFGVGELDNCRWLLENTYYINDSYIYGYFLETVRSNNSNSAWMAFGDNRLLYPLAGTEVNTRGVRPVIEVQTSKISY